MKKYLHISLLVFYLIPLSIFATHNRGGDITYRHISGLTYEFTITTCTDVAGPNPVDRNQLEIDYGDGNKDTLARTQIVSQPLSHQINTYVGTHTYTSPGTYVICMEDPNRNAGILNIYPNGPSSSDNVSFSLHTELIIDPFSGASGANNSVQFNNCPCPAIGCVNYPYTYNSQAYDPDGDSLSYSLVPPYGANCAPLTQPTVFVYPNQVGGGTFSVDPITGTIMWNSPGMIGEFNYAVKITEWRNGVVVGYVVRDIQVTIEGNCNNTPPTVTAPSDTCVVAGSTIQFNVVGHDVDGNTIDLEGSGTPLVLPNSPATFTAAQGIGSVSQTFTWNTTCDHIQSNPYQMLFTVTDHGNPPFLNTVSSMIRVIPPQVTGLTASAFGNSINLNWQPSSCTNAEGYRVYRITSPSFTIPDCCSGTSLTSVGFQLVSEQFGYNNTSYSDYGLSLGTNYCYVVVAFYDYGQLESCPSNAACAQLSKDVPVITHVTVNETNSSTGVDSIRWSKPTELDTSQYPGPYFYKIYHGMSLNNANTFIGQTSPSTLLYSTDTSFTHLNINTDSQINYYRIELFYTNSGNDSLVGTSNTAGSIFLQTTPNDNQIQLDWDEQVPWINTSYVIFRSTSFNGVYSAIDTTTNQTYLDTGLVNGATYCYYVKSIGYYSDPSITNPIENLSQIVCDSPIDKTPPCPPVVSIDGDCDAGINTIIWTNPNNNCADDVTHYNIYYTPIENQEMSLIATINSATDTVFTHSNNGSVAGCYVVTALDSIQYNNESDSSNIVCFDNCPDYWLPNVFTPNNDGTNDFFGPLKPYKYIDHIDITIFNRWGQAVFTSQDPDINWDGINQTSGKMVSDGVYYYICIVYSIRLSGLEPIELKGFLHKIGNQANPNQ